MRNNHARELAGNAYIGCALCGLTVSQLKDGSKVELVAVMKAHLRQNHTEKEYKKVTA
jgi:hypothetical protein